MRACTLQLVAGKAFVDRKSLFQKVAIGIGQVEGRAGGVGQMLGIALVLEGVDRAETIIAAFAPPG